MTETDRTSTSFDDAMLGAAMLQLYRADMHRSVGFQRRLDRTTGWAVSVSLALGLFAISDPRVSHAALIVVMGADLGFAVLEARRFADGTYAASRERLLLVESSFDFEGDAPLVSRELRDAMLDTLRNPDPRVDWQTALGSRLRRNHLAILGFVLVVWLTKLYLLGGTWDATSMVAHAAIATIPGIVVCMAVGVFYGGLAVLAVTTRRSVHQVIRGVATS